MMFRVGQTSQQQKKMMVIGRNFDRTGTNYYFKISVMIIEEFKRDSLILKITGPGNEHRSNHSVYFEHKTTTLFIANAQAK